MPAPGGRRHLRSEVLGNRGQNIEQTILQGRLHCELDFLCAGLLLSLEKFRRKTTIENTERHDCSPYVLLVPKGWKELGTRLISRMQRLI